MNFSKKLFLCASALALIGFSMPAQATSKDPTPITNNYNTNNNNNANSNTNSNTNANLNLNVLSNNASNSIKNTVSGGNVNTNVKGGNAKGGTANTTSGNATTNGGTANTYGGIANGGNVTGGSATTNSGNINAQGGKGGNANAAGGSGGSAVGNGTVNNNMSVNTKNDVAASSAYAAPLVAGDDTCMGSSTAGGQGVGFGVSLGSTWSDEDCVRRKDATFFRNIGLDHVSVALMCQKEQNRQAILKTGDARLIKLCEGADEPSSPAATARRAKPANGTSSFKLNN